ncbi:hypothetical protein BC827DRAFT_1269010 [Russula dissimulans]|nr:hypothetical protein BC827DRAFT_1269010 [Russula dissimulans]
MEEPNDDIDTETLQAQIDLSMAYAQSLVASWLPGSNSLTQPSSRAAEAEAELQAILRRPPRLGVGAPLPETPALSQTRLVKKLQGGKRRAQQMENGTSASASTSTMVQNNGGQEEDDSAEESRAGTIRKRERVDPFEPGKKKKKRRKNAEMEEVAAVTTPPAKEDVVLEDAPQTGAMETVDTTARTRPKKKKKKKKGPHESLGVGGFGAAVGGPVREASSPSRGHNAEPAEPSGSVQSAPDEWDGINKHQQRRWSGSSGSSDSVLPTGGGAPSPVVSPRPPRRSLSTTSLIQQPPNTSQHSALPTSSSPILNLTGPPAIASENVESSPHKKRKRKRKKKNRTGNQGAGDYPP